MSWALAVRVCVPPSRPLLQPGVPDKKLTVIVLTNEQGLLPALAPNIASRYLPPLPALDAPGIPDAEPALSATLRAVVVGLMNGTLDGQGARAGLRVGVRGSPAPGGGRGWV